MPKARVSVMGISRQNSREPPRRQLDNLLPIPLHLTVHLYAASFFRAIQRLMLNVPNASPSRSKSHFLSWHITPISLQISVIDS